MNVNERGHVEDVVVSRCGDWSVGRCPGDEHGCDRCAGEGMYGYETLAHQEADLILDLEGEELEEWVQQPHPTTRTHAQFVREYGRCPDTCRPAVQMTLGLREGRRSDSLGVDG